MKRVVSVLDVCERVYVTVAVTVPGKPCTPRKKSIISLIDRMQLSVYE